MGFGVFIHRSDSIYDDSPAERYQFPRQYLGRVGPEILISRRVNDQEGVRGLINKDGRARPPHRGLDRPHPHFLQWHRDCCFKQ